MNIKITHPLISCICITDNRPQYLLRSVLCFDTQSYPNKELVISYPKDDLVTKNLVNQINQLSDLRIVAVERNPEVTLGSARNEAIVHCNGEYICTWDDDDWYHSKRVIHQFNSLRLNGKNYEASILNHIMIYDTVEESAYISCSFRWGGTLLCKKSLLLDYPYADTQIIEDNYLIKSLESRKFLTTLSDCYYLYLFIYHGQNIFNHFHYLYLIKKSSALDQQALEWLKNLAATTIEINGNIEDEE